MQPQLHYSDQQTIPLLWDTSTTRVFAHCNDAAPIDVATFLTDVRRTVSQLPQHKYVVNTCEDRYHFIVSFSAALCSGKTTLLPPSSAPKTVSEILADYPDSCLLSDVQADEYLHPDVLLNSEALASERHEGRADNTPFIPEIDASHLAAITFTSGSTGKSVAHKMSWYKLSTSARILDAALSRKTSAMSAIVATVPPQHMYGLETSVMLPMQSSRSVFIPHSFYPSEVKAALTKLGKTGLLVTTPVHLRVLDHANLQYPETGLILSATASLNQELAASCEGKFSCGVEEIYGSSETGAIAMRQTSVEKYWRLVDGVDIKPIRDGVEVTAPGLFSTACLSDVVEMTGDRQFRLLGRGRDVIKIAGKRQSLKNLNTLLLSIKGVEDAVVFFPPSNDVDNRTAPTRLAALVVADGVKPGQIADEMRNVIDPVFVPRPMYFVDRLPRNATGKLPAAAINELWKQLRAVDD